MWITIAKPFSSQAGTADGTDRFYSPGEVVEWPSAPDADRLFAVGLAQPSSLDEITAAKSRRAARS